VIGRVAKVEMTVRFNASVSAREGRRQTKCCQKMKRRQRAHLASMGRKRDTTRQNDDVDRRRCAIGEGKGRRQCLLG
jgi:hypothetical protein